jgi:hypothetical protein
MTTLINYFRRISQDLALDIAVHLTSEVRDATSGHWHRRAFFAAHNATEIPAPRPKKSTEYSTSPSDGASTKVASGHELEIETVLASCRPSLLHLLPILEELGVRRSEHMTALA